MEVGAMARWTQRCLAVTISLLFVLMLSGPAAAAQFTLQSVWLTTHGWGDGLGISWMTNPGMAPWTFTLNEVGDFASRQLIRIGTPEFDMEADDLVPKDATATFTFSQPPGVSGPATGESYGQATLGYVDWQTPAIIDFGAGGELTISLADVSFGLNSWKWWEKDDPNIGYTGVPDLVTITMTREPVPQPMTLLLLGAGVTAASFSARLLQRRRQ
jgi:hypothetical protein